MTTATLSPGSINRRILVIDDNEMIHQDFQKILAPAPEEHSGAFQVLEESLFGEKTRVPPPIEPFIITTALQGEQGVELVRQAVRSVQPFSVAFVDMRMPPGWDGLETISRIWESDPEVHVVICTAYSDHSYEEIARRLRRRDQLLILKKPFDAIEVMQLAQALATKWTLTRQVQDQLRNLEALVSARTQELRSANAQLTAEIRQHQTSIAQLALVKQQIERMLSLLPLALIGVDRERRITHWNHVAERLFSIPAARAVGMVLGDVGVSWDAAGVSALLSDASAGHPAVEHQVGFTTTSGDHGLLLAAAVPMPGSQETLIYAQDVTRRRLLELQLMQSQKLEAIGQLASGIAHEINTPTQFVGDNLRFLREAFDALRRVIVEMGRLAQETGAQADLTQRLQALLADADFSYFEVEVPKALAQSEEGIAQIGSIVSAMREFAHRTPDAKTPCTIPSLVEPTLAVCRNEYKYVAEVCLDLAPDLPSVPCYPDQVKQVLLNLIVNAAHAIAEAKRPTKGKITITARADPQAVTIAVTDNGSGMPPAVQAHIFEPFFTTKPVGKGTGQGLYLCRQMIHGNHGGELHFRSSPGMGTTFTLRLPLDAAPAAAEAPAAQV